MYNIGSYQDEVLCDVIIDGGSTNNLVLEKMVMKLKLKRKKIPTSISYYLAIG